MQKDRQLPVFCAPSGTRIPVLALRGPRPRPLDEWGLPIQRMGLGDSNKRPFPCQPQSRMIRARQTAHDLHVPTSFAVCLTRRVNTHYGINTSIFSLIASITIGSSFHAPRLMISTSLGTSASYTNVGMSYWL